MANAPHITMANAPHITMATPPHIRWRTLHTYDGERSTHTMANAPHIRWRTLHTYDGERSTHTMANAPHIRWRTLHTYDGERSMRWGTPVIGDALMTGACEGDAAERDTRERTLVSGTVEAMHSWIVWL